MKIKYDRLNLFENIKKNVFLDLGQYLSENI